MESIIDRDCLEQFGDLAEKNRSGLKKYIGRLTSDEEKARDILQETMLTAFQNFSSLKEAKAFPAWTRKIAYRIYLADRDGAGEEEALPFEDKQYQSEVFSPEILLEKEEKLDKIYRTLGSLKRQDRKMFLLYYLFGYTHGEIAERFTISESASKKRLERIRKKFCDLWGDDMGSTEKSPANDTLHDISLQASFERASWMGELTLIEAMLMDGLEINEQDRYGRTLLHYAAASGNGEAVRLLLRNGGRGGIKDKSGATPESLAADRGFHDIREMLR